MIQGGLPRWPDADRAGRGKVLPFVLREDSVNQDGDVPPVPIKFVSQLSIWPDEKRTLREHDKNGRRWAVLVVTAIVVAGLLWRMVR